MEPWGDNQTSTEQAVEPLRQADVSATEGTASGRAKLWKISVALLAASSLALVVGGTFHGWRKSAPLRVQGSTIAANKSVIGKFADQVLKGSSLFGGSGSSAAKLEASKASKMSGAPVSLPLFFEANRGQTDGRVKFLARSSGYTLFVTPTETVFAGAWTTTPRGMLPTADTAADNGAGQAILRMKLLESNPGPEINGAKELPGKVNYLIGNNPRDWHTGVPMYEEVRSREVYPGIDLVFHGDQQRLEYDFQVAPGADPGRIRFRVTGAEKVAVDENGDLLLKTPKSEFRMRKPVMYQQVGEQRQPVDGSFSLQAGKLVAFRVGAYNKSMPLVIDPTIVFASFLGAAGQEAIGAEDLDVTNPSAPKLFVAGSTSDVTTFTETKKVLGTAPGAVAYAFVAKIDPKTTGAASLDFLTFIGGSLVFTGGTAPCQNFATDMKLDVSGGVGQVEPVLLGQTNCRDFPVTFGGPTTGTDDLFISRLTPDGAALDRSTLFGGNGSEGLSFGGASLYLNPEGTIVLSGETTSTDFATTSNAYSVSLNNGTPGGFDDCFVAKMDRSFSILYLTYLNVGGSSSSTTAANCGVGAIDPAGKIYVGGNIYSSTAFSLANGGTGANGFQKTFVGTPGTTPNTFVAVLDPSQGGLNQLTYSSYLAGGGGTNVQAGAVDVAHGIAVIGGTTISNSATNAPDIPLLNAFQSTNNSPAGVGTGWIAVIDTTKSGVISLVASTYFGGSTGAGSSSVHSVAIDPVPGNSPTQRIVVGGQTTATNFPTMNPLQASLVGGQNAFVSVLSVPSSGSTFNMSLLFSTYLGGGVTVSSQSESVRALITDSNHAIYALGRTPSANFFGNTSPATTVNGFQTTCASCGGGTPQADLAIFVLTPQSATNVPDLTVTKSHSGNFSQGQSGAQYSITVTNSGTGATVGTVSLADSLPSSMTPTAMTGTGWTCSISTLVCTRSDALGAGLSYPVITLTVTVAGNAPPSVTNTVTVSGGSETNTANDTASDVTAITSSVGACTNTYTGASGGSWGTATNWSKGAVPISTDVACIAGGITVLVNTGLVAANQTISGLNSAGTITFTSGPLTVTNNSVANAINLNGGTLAFNGQLTVSGAFSQTNGTLGGTGEVDLNGAFSWSGGTICSTLSGGSCVAGANAKINANAGITFPASSNVLLSFRTLNNNGTATWSGTAGSIDMINGSVINNLLGSVWNYTNDSDLAFGGGNAVAFNNAGTFEKTGGTTTTTIGVPFNNTGMVLGNTATFSFTNGGNCGSSCSGTFTATTPGIISFGNGIFGQSGPINGTGTLNFAGATMDFGMGVEIISTTTVNINAGVLGGAAPGVLNFETRPNWSGGTMCSSLSGISCVAGTNGTTNANAGINFPSGANVLLSFRTLNNNGTATWSGNNGSFDVINGSIINNPLGSVWNNTNDSVLVFGGGAAVAFNNAGTFEKTGGTATSIIGLNFNNTGTVLGNSGTLSFTGGGNCGSTCSGMFTATTPGIISFGNGMFGQSGSINGTGTVNFTGATMNFGTGTETISTATINFTAGTLGGAAPGILNFSTPLNWTGGTMCSSLSGISCVAGTNGTTNANAGISFPSSSNVALSFRTLNNNGTATWSGTAGSIDMVNASVINNPLGSVWNNTNDSVLVFGGGAAVAFNNAGTFEKTGGTATSTVGLPFNNTGTVLGNSGTMSFTGGGNCGSTCAGTFTATTPGVINFGANVFGQSGPINGTGTVNFNGATMNFGTGTETISTSTVNFSAGTLAGAAPGILNFTTLLNWSGGTMCSSLSGISCVAGTNGTTNANAGISFPSSSNVALSFRTLNNNGTATWSGTAGSIDMVNASVINNPLGSVWNYTNDSILVFGGGNAVAFNNAGTFEKTGGTGTSNVNVAFNNTGTVSGNSGILSFGSGGNCGSTCSGTFSAGLGGAISFPSGTYPVSGPFNGAGTVNFSGAAMNLTGAYGVTGPTNVSAGTVNFNEASPVTIAGPLNFTAGSISGSVSTLNLPGLFTWSGGTLALPGTTNASGGIAFPNAGAMFLNGGTLNTPAAVTFAAGGSGSSFLQSNGSAVNNTGTWNLQGDDFITFNGGTATTFNNNVGGTFEKTGGTTSSQIGVPFKNMGTVLANAATLFFTTTFTQTAGKTSLNGGSLETFSTNPLLIQGGLLTGTGTVQGDVTNTGGGVAPGSATAAGNISLSGSSLGIYSQSVTGAYNVKIGGATAGQFDTLTMSGAATLGGPLNVSLINAFSPAVGNTFTILTAASVSGTFSTTNFPALSAGLGWHITYNATNVVLSIVSVSSPVANLNPGSVTFPNTIVNTAAAIQKVQLQNTGTVALIITSIQPTGTDAANYSYTADATQPCPISPATLGVGGSCMLDIGFLPLTAGTHNNAQITVTDNSGNVVGSTQTVALSGTGIVLSSIAVTPNPASIPQGATQQFTATGTFSDSSMQNLTSSVTWASATTSVATINAAGLATGASPGMSNITAKQGSVTSPASVLTVTGATHFAVSSPVNIIAGTSFSFTIFAEDQFNNVVPGYTGTVHFTSSDPMAILPANSTLTNGSGNFQATLKTVGSQTYTATDTVTSSITGTSNPVTVGTGAVTHFQVSLSGSPIIGSADSFHVVALDQFGNAVTGYTGTVHFTSTDPSAVLPANTTLTSGAGTFPVTFKTVGNQSVTATDTVTSSITGTSNAIAVVSGAATHFAVSMPGGATVGTATSVTVTALDQSNNAVAGYTGTVHFTSTDASAILPANTTLTNGTGTFPVTFKTVGSQTVTATDTVTASITGTSNTITVGSGTATHLVVVALPSVTAGTPFNITVAALDQFNNAVTGYTGTVHFTSTDGAAVLPANSTLTNGAGVFPVTLKTLGSQTVTATDTVTASITGTSHTITVGSGVVTHFVVAAPASATAGTAVSVSVTALDQFNNLVTGYTGTVHFTSTDGAAVLPANSTLTSGTGVFQATLKTAGAQTVTATDTVTSTIKGTSNTITVGSTTATHLLVGTPGAATAGTSFNIIVTALDQFNNPVTGYTGTVHFTSTDGAAVLPANSTLTNGTGVFAVTLKTPGSQTVTGTDTVTASITGTSNPTTVGSGTATHFVVSAPGAATAGAPFNVTVKALDSFGNVVTTYPGTVFITSSDGKAVLPPSSTLTNGVGVFAVTLVTAGNKTVTATDTISPIITGTSSLVAVSPGTTTHLSVSAPAAATAGLPFNVSVTALDQFSNVVTNYPGTVHVTSSDGKAVLPPNSTLTSGASVFAATLETAGNQTVTATDTSNASINGTTAAIAVSPATATHLSLAAPGVATSGTPFNITVTALDQFGNQVTGYAGTVHFISSDANAVLPTDSKLANGTAQFAVTLKTAGIQSITGTDTATVSITGTSTVTVTAATLKSIAITPASPTIAKGLTVQLKATGTFSDNSVSDITSQVTWNSATPGVATVSTTGLAFGAGIGTSNITASLNGVTSPIDVLTVTAATLKSIAITPVSPSIAKGLTLQLKATGTFSDNSVQDLTTQVTWGTTAPGVATVSATGLATGVGTGTSNITASLNAITSPIDQLTVTAATLKSITITPVSPSIAKGTTLQLTATGTFSDGSMSNISNQVVWASATASVAAINATGLATGVGTGTSNITASLNGVTSPIDVLTVTVAVATLQSITVLPANPTLAISGKETFLAIGHFSDGSTQNLTSTVTWGSGTTSVATITTAGVATGVGAGTSTISATLGAVSGSTVLTVTATAAHAYVGNFVSANCCLAVLDTSTNQIVKTIPITNINEPFGITPDQSRVYVPDNVSNLVNVVDTTTNTLMTTIPTGMGATEVAITPDGKFGYVALLAETNVSVFSVATNAVVATVPMPTGFIPVWVTVTPDGSSVYATGGQGGQGNTVVVINTSTNTVSSTFTVPAPAGQTSTSCLANPLFNPTGTLVYILQQPSCSTIPATANGLVNVISVPSNTPVATIPAGVNPSGSVLSSNGARLYVVNNGSKTVPSNSVTVIDTTNNTVITTVPVGQRPTALALTPDGTLLYTTDSRGNTLSIIQTATNTVTSTIPFTGPFGILFASPPPASAATTLTLTPPNLVFNAQVNGTQSASQTINVKNPGGSPVTLTNVSLTGPNTGDFRLTNGCPTPPATLGAGLSCNLQISSDPTTNGPLTALVAINSTNGIAASTQSAPLSGTGISLVSIAVTPASISVTATKTVQFTATGTFNDNSTQDLTNSVNWSSSSLGIATINASGLATGVTAGGPITITATSGNIFGTAQLTVTSPVVTFPLNVTLIGTGTGSVTDNLGSINCVDTAGVITGTCSANYPMGTVVMLTATPTAPSTFGGWLQVCSGTAGCSVTMNSAQSVTASFVPPPKMIPVPFTPGANVSGMATYDCPSNPNPTPANPCLDPNAHATSLTIGQVITPFTLTVVSTEVPPTNGNGICENGRTPGQDLDCRFESFFTFLTEPNGDRIVPLCDPYANGNCVVYSVFFQKPGQEPDPSMYVGPINWNITFNNGTFVPPAPWTGSTPQLYYDPSGFVVPNSPYGTDCTTPMLIGNPGVPTNPAIFCQFVFNITTVFDASKKVDPLLGGKTRVFSDVVVAFPPIFAPVVTVTTTPDAATVTAGSPIGFTIAVSNSAAATANNVSLNTPLPGGTNVNWTISPAYAGPGTCSITGAQGSQVLNCAFGTLNPSTNLSVHIQSAASAAGTAISTSTVAVGSQQILSIGSIVVQPIAVTFSGLTASQSIPAGTSSVTLSGVIGNGTQFAPSGETVSITINGNTQTATVGSNGTFSLQFPTAAIPGSTTPYPITYSYAGDSLLSSATNNSTTLTVVSPPPGVVLSASQLSATVDASGNYVFTIRVTNSGGTAATATAIKTATLTTVIGTTRLTTATTTTLPVNLGNIASLSSVTTTLTFPASAGPPNTVGAISLGFGFTGGSAGGTLKATLP